MEVVKGSVDFLVQGLEDYMVRPAQEAIQVREGEEAQKRGKQGEKGRGRNWKD